MSSDGVRALAVHLGSADLVHIDAFTSSHRLARMVQGSVCRKVALQKALEIVVQAVDLQFPWCCGYDKLSSLFQGSGQGPAR